MSRCDSAACLLAVVTLLAAAGPAAAQDDDLVTPVRVGRADAPMTLNVWAQPDYFHLAARPAIANAFTIVLDDWARSHPAVQLRVSVMPGLELHKTKLQLAAAAGRLPDIASIDSYWLPLFVNDVQPLDPNWPADDRADFLPFTIQTLSDKAGHVLGMWHETDCRVLFYRKDLVPAPPRTWDQLLETASRVAREQKMSRLSLQRGPMGSDGLRSPRRCSGRRAASSSTATAGRSSARSRTAAPCCACWASCATRFSAARRRDPSSASPTTSR